MAALSAQLGGTVIEIWFADEARVGQKNKITRRWARRGSRPAAPKDQRTASVSLFGAICPALGKGAGLVLVDRAGWHLSRRLVVPENLTLLLLPPRSPELNPVETVWQFLRDNWLSNRIFASEADIVDHCCAAWNELMAQPWRIMSIGLRQCAHRS